MPHMQFLCHNCGKDVYPKRTKFCDDCIPLIRTTQHLGKRRATWLTIECLTCGSVVECKSSHVRKFCSKECHVVHQQTLRGDQTSNFRGGPVTLECQTCQTAFQTKRNLVDTAKFCSTRCRSVWTVSHQGSVSTVELAVGEELDRRGIRYEHQSIVAGLVPDFRIDRTILEVDGDYWHTLPGVPERDARKDRTYRDHGFNVIRIWEHEVRAGDFSKLDVLVP